MSSNPPVTERIRGFCALCISRCGSIATVENGRFTELAADPEHPTGQAFCIKGRAAPELVYHPERLLHPLRRTRPKGDPDPGWQRIGWDEAIGLYSPPVGGTLFVAGRIAQVGIGPISVALMPLFAASLAVLMLITYVEVLPMGLVWLLR